MWGDLQSGHDAGEVGYSWLWLHSCPILQTSRGVLLIGHTMGGLLASDSIVQEIGRKGRMIPWMMTTATAREPASRFAVETRVCRSYAPISDTLINVIFRSHKPAKMDSHQRSLDYHLRIPELSVTV